MSKLSVTPARRIYHPKYPSYFDKNPLQYPETKPYPFTARFVQGVVKGGLAGLLLFTGESVSGQTTYELENPFLMGNASVPYMPAMFGTGQPRRLNRSLANEVIRKAFKSAGIELEYDTYYDSNGVRGILDGYSCEDSIGYVFMDYQTMDDTYYSKNKKSRNYKDFDKRIESSERRLEQQFQKFCNDGKKFCDDFVKYNTSIDESEFIEKVKNLASDEESRSAFRGYWIDLKLKQTQSWMTKSKFHNEVLAYINNNNLKPIEQLGLLSVANGIRIPESLETQLYTTITKQKNKNLKRYIKSLHTIDELIDYGYRAYLPKYHEEVLEIKSNIIQNYPPEDWLKKTQEIDNLIDNHKISMHEVEMLEEANDSGEEHIATIFRRDPMLILNKYSYTEEGAKQSELLSNQEQELRTAKKELLKERDREINALYEELRLNQTETNDSLLTQETAHIDNKYEAQLQKHENAITNVKAKRRGLYDQERQHALDVTLQNLETQVLRYIEWVKSERGY